MKSLILFLFILLSLTTSCKDNSQKNDVENKNSEIQNEVVGVTDDRVILFFGNSLTAGYGLEESEAFPALIQKRLDSLGYNYEVVNAGISGETTSGGLNRLDWTLNQEIDIFVLELGANDGLRGVPLSETRKNLQSIIDIVKQKNNDTEIILTGMQLPPNMGPEYTTEFRKIFPELASSNDIKLVPFLLEGVGGIPSLNQQDGIHPTEEGHKILADNVWNVMQDVVKEQSQLK